MPCKTAHKRKINENEDFQANVESCDGNHRLSNQVERVDCLWEVPRQANQTDDSRGIPGSGKPQGKGKGKGTIGDRIEVEDQEGITPKQSP